jgi:SPP1 family predicted phage head-tail adaptor
MNAGLLKERVAILQAAEGNSYGEYTASWSTTDTVWAQVLPAGSREVYRQSQVTGELSYVVRIRYRSDMTAKDRLTWGTKTLQITGTPFEEWIEGTRLLNCPCVEVDS